ncbi:MAG: MFS transporter [Planctomycetota bacterium]
MVRPKPQIEPTSTPGKLPSGLLLGVVAVFVLMPATLPVTVLRGLVHDRFGVSEFATSVFMSINMVAALCAAPWAGMLADRIGRQRRLLAGALILDGLLFGAMTLDLPFGVFLTLRFFEGASHITALSLLLSIAAETARRRGGRNGAILGMVGAGLTLGVALGAPIGGVLGRVDALLPIRVAAGISLLLAAAALAFIPSLGSSSGRPGYRAILAALREQRMLFVPWSYAFVDRFTVGFFTTTFTLWMKRVHDLPPDRIGLLLGLFLGPFSLLSYPFGKLSERLSRTRMLAFGSLVYGAGLIGLGSLPLSALPVAMVGLGVVSAVMFVPSLVLTAELVPSTVRSTALGGFNAAGSLGFVLGPLVGAGVSSTIASAGGGTREAWADGYRLAFATAGVAEVLCVLATWTALSRLRASGRTT